jgi:2-hydroxychromene-2-carboxylate isomerase
MKLSSLDFYFDFLSPFAFFAWREVGPLCEKYELEMKAHPVVFGKLLDHWGQLGPAEIVPKRDWASRYCLRYSALHGFEHNPPKYHPFNPLAALRLSLKEVSGAQQSAVIDAIFHRGWTEGEDIGDITNLLDILEREKIDISGFEEKIQQQAIKDSLANETSNAIELGVFGVPTIIVGDQLFWGNDQFDHIRLLLDGNDPLDARKHKMLGSRPRMIDRNKFQKLKNSKQ